MEQESHQEGTPPNGVRRLVRAIAQSVGEELVGRRLSDEELVWVERRLGSKIGAIAGDTRHGIQGIVDEPPVPQRAKVTPPELARLWGISPDRVLGWIRSGELAAINVASHRGARPRYLIDWDDIQSFEARRSVVTPNTVRRGTKHKNTDLIEFF